MIFVRLVGWPRLISATAVLVLPGVVAYNQALLCWSFRRSARRVASTVTACHTMCPPTPRRRANDLVFSVRRLPATEAHALGLVDHLVAVEESGTEVARRAAELAAGPAIALGLAKRLLDQSLESSLAEMAQLEADGSGRVLLHEGSFRGQVGGPHQVGTRLRRVRERVRNHKLVRSQCGSASIATPWPTSTHSVTSPKPSHRSPGSRRLER